MNMPSPYSFKLLLSALVHAVTIAASTHHRLSHDHHVGLQMAFANIGRIPDSTRVHWMRRAKDALLELTGTPCPFQAFGTAIVNHTGKSDYDLGELICIGVNGVMESGNPTLHGEVAAINNCTTVMSSEPYNLSPAEIGEAWKDLSLYTTAEACSMCASAIGWAGFREYIYATRIRTLIDLGWSQGNIGSREALERGPKGGHIRVVIGALENETDALFRWQFTDGDCPPGCAPAAEATLGSAKCVKAG